MTPEKKFFLHQSTVIPPAGRCRRCRCAGAPGRCFARSLVARREEGERASERSKARRSERLSDKFHSTVISAQISYFNMAVHDGVASY